MNAKQAMRKAKKLAVQEAARADEEQRRVRMVVEQVRAASVYT